MHTCDGRTGGRACDGRARRARRPGPVCAGACSSFGRGDPCDARTGARLPRFGTRMCRRACSQLAGSHVPIVWGGSRRARPAGKGLRAHCTDRCRARAPQMLFRSSVQLERSVSHHCRFFPAQRSPPYAWRGLAGHLCSVPTPGSPKAAVSMKFLFLSG